MDGFFGIICCTYFHTLYVSFAIVAFFFFYFGERPIDTYIVSCWVSSDEDACLLHARNIRL